MLDPQILAALKEYTTRMSRRVDIVLQPGDHEKRAELKGMLEQIAGLTDHIGLVTDDASLNLRSGVSYSLRTEDGDTGIRFSGVPGGHEFNSLILALLQAGGVALKLDEGIQSTIRRIEGVMSFETVVSLSCHNCPEVVQALNQFALLNEGITHEMIDGGVFPGLVEERGIQGVPAVFLDGESFGDGRMDTGRILDKLLETRSVAEAPRAAGDDTVWDMTVVGGGPAGAAAAIYTARKGFKVQMIAERQGGQVRDTMAIENLISVSKTTGPELSTALREHMGDYDIPLRDNLRVKEIEDGDVKKLMLNSGEVIQSRTVVLATGARWRELGVPGEKEYIGKGVAYCPHCDGPFFKGKDVAVIGGGNSGVEAALDLAGIVGSVTVIEFLPELKADQVLIDQLEKRDNVRVIRNAATKEILASDGKHVDSLVYTDRGTKEEHSLEIAGVFIQIGLVPVSEYVEGLVEKNRFGEIVVNEKCETSRAGIYACGDVTTVPYKQIIVAMGEGAKAGMAASEYLLMQG